MRTLLQGVDTVISCDPNDRVYRNADVWFCDGKIEGIGTFAGNADKTFDCRGMILASSTPIIICISISPEA